MDSKVSPETVPKRGAPNARNVILLLVTFASIIGGFFAMSALYDRLINTMPPSMGVMSIIFMAIIPLAVAIWQIARSDILPILKNEPGYEPIRASWKTLALILYGIVLFDLATRVL